MTDTTHLGLPFIEGSQAQKHVTHNEALRILDTLVMLAVFDRDLSAPPGSPAEGARYLVKATGTGTFAGKDNQIATYTDGEWWFFPPRAGWSCYVQDENVLLAWNGSAWNPALDVLGGVSELQNLSKLGIAATADATNPLSAKLNNALFTARTVAEGGSGDLRYKMSKEAAGKTLSLLLQNAYSGRAEIGLTGDDDFHFKVSPDGSSWTDALLIDRTTGSAKLNSGFFLTGDISPAQITADQNDYNPAGLAAASVLRLSSNASRNMTGLSGGGDGRIVTIVNVGSNAIVLKDASTSSTAANRFSFGTDVTLASSQSAVLWYDVTDARWKLLAGPVAAASSSIPSDLDITLAEMALQIADNSGAALVFGSAANRFADSFKALTYVDVAGATNLDSGTSGILKPTVTTSGDQTATHTGYTQSGNTASASTEYSGTYAWKAFDKLNGSSGSDANAWAAGSGNTTGWLQYQFGTAKTVASYTLTAPLGLETWMAKSWTLQGSNTGAFSGEQVTLDTQTNITSWTSPNQTRTFTISSPASYTYYRLVISANNGASYLSIDEMTLRTAGATNNIAVASTARTAATAPASMKLVARFKPIDSITLGTDLIFEVSRDGGTTWTSVTMTDRFTSDSPAAGIHILEGSEVSVTAQPSGTSPKWRVRSANNKNFELHDIYLRWS